MLDAQECLELIAAAAEAESKLSFSEEELVVVHAFQHHLVIAMGARGLIAKADAAQAFASASQALGVTSSVGVELTEAIPADLPAQCLAVSRRIVEACRGVEDAISGPTCLQHAAIFADRSRFDRSAFLLEAGRLWDKLAADGIIDKNGPMPEPKVTH